MLEPPHRRLDPFLLPSSTTTRFVLLILTALIGALSLCRWLAESWHALTGASIPVRYAPCIRDGERLATLSDPVRVVDGYRHCVALVTWREGLLVAGMSLLPVLVAAGSYLGRFWWRGRRLRPLPPGTPLAELAAERLPGVAVLLDARLWTELAVADGPARIAVSPRLLMEAARDRRLAEGVLAHEAAHLRNADVLPTWLAWSTWWSFLLVTVVPTTVVVAVAAPGMLPRLAVQAGSLLIVLRLARDAVLRSRELYADVRAAGDEGQTSSLAYALGTPPQRPARRKMWHPAARDRHAVLAEPDRLLGPQIWEAAAVGYLIGFTASALMDLISSIHSGLNQEVRFVPVSLLLGLIFAGSLGMAIWRGVWRSMTTGAPRPRPAPAAGALTLGVLAGQACLTWAPDTGVWTTVAGWHPVTGITLAALLFAGSWIAIRWTAAAARAHLARGRSPRRAALAGVLVVGLALGPWFGVWCNLVVTAAVAKGSINTLLLDLYAQLRNPLPVLACLGGALFVTGLRPVMGQGVARPFLGDPATVGWRLPVVRFRPVGLAVLGAALLAIPVPALMSAHIHAVASTQAQWNTYLELHGLMLLGIAVAAAGLAGFLTPRCGPIRAVAHAVLAATLAALPVAAIESGGWFAAAYGWDNVGIYAARRLGSVVNAGGALSDILIPAVIAAVLMSGPVAAIRYRRRPTEPPAGPGGRIPVLTLVAVMTVLTGIAGASRWGLITPPHTVLWPSVFAAEQEPLPAGPLPHAQVCAWAGAMFATPGVTDSATAQEPYYVGLMRIARTAEITDDPLLRAMGAAQHSHLRGQRAWEASQTYVQMLHYCGVLSSDTR